MESSQPLKIRTVLFFGFTAVATGPAWAGEKPATPSGLPGVDGKYNIVRPAPPEPEPDQPKQSRPGQWDVTVSGTVTIDVTTGGLPLSRR